MKSRPLTLIPELARKAIDGGKTRTSRPVSDKVLHAANIGLIIGDCSDGSDNEWAAWSPLGKVGDRLWLRERARVIDAQEHTTWGVMRVKLLYELDGFQTGWMPYPNRLARPVIGKCIANGCFKESARYFFEITGVRVERIQDITDNEVFKEGIDVDGTSANGHIFTAREHFHGLWKSIYPGSWERNDWIFATEFKRVNA